MLKNKLLGAVNKRILFVKVVQRATEEEQLLVEDNFWTKGHDLKEQISKELTSKLNCDDFQQR